MAKEPMEEELEIVPTPSKEVKVEDMSKPVTITIVINDRPDLEYTVTKKDLNAGRNRIVYDMNKDEIAAWKEHMPDEPCPMRIILPKLWKDQVSPDIRFVRNRNAVPEDKLMDELTKSFKKIDEGEYYEPILMPPVAADSDMTITGLYNVVYEEPVEDGEPAVLKSITPKKGQKVPRVVVQPNTLEVFVNIPVLESNIDELDIINLNTSNSKRLRLIIVSERYNVEFVAEDRDRMYFKRSSFRIGESRWTSNKSFNRWIVANKEDTEHYHDVHAKLEGSVNYPKVWKDKDPYKSKSEYLRKKLNEIRGRGNREDDLAAYKEEDKEFKNKVLESGRAGVPEFRHAKPSLHKQVLKAEFSYVEEDAVHDYSKDGYEADLEKFDGKDWAKYTTFKKKYANRDANKKLAEPVEVEYTRFSVKIEVVEYEKNKYVTITGKMPDRDSFKKFVNMFKDPVKRIVIEVEPLNEVELAEINAFKRANRPATGALSEADKQLVEEAREEMYENLIGAPAQKGELQTVSGTAGSGMEEVPMQTIGEPTRRELTQEEFNLLSPEEKDNYNVWADENGYETRD